MNDSVKKEMVLGMSVIPTIDGLESNKLQLVTAIGLISGRLAPTDITFDKEETSHFSRFITSRVLDVLKKQHEDEPVGDNGCFLLVDVTLNPLNNGPVVKLDSLVVFYDQIIGVTIGDAPKLNG